MNLQHPYALPFFGVGLLVLGALALGIASRRRVHVFWEYAVMMGSVALHTLAYSFDLASTSLEQKLFFHQVAWLGFAVTPSAMLLLALHFARKPAKSLLKGALFACSVATVLLAWTNGLHHWLEGPARLASHGSYALRLQAQGPAFWAYIVYAGGCAFAAIGIYGAAWLSGPVLQRRQARMLFFAMLAPWVLNVVFLSGASPIRLTPIAVGVSVLLITWALFREGFLDLVPVAHETVIETIGNPIFVLDSRGRVVDANPAARALSERPFDIGAHARESFAFLDRASWPEHAEVIVVSGRSFEMRTMPIAAEGRVVTLHDVTAREAQEGIIKRALAARSEFIARMSHELRTPLQGILGSLELLERAGVDEGQRSHTETARCSAGVLLALVDDVLDFERSADGVELETGQVDVRAIVDDVVAAASATAKLKGIALSADTRSVAPYTFLGDARRIRQVVLNLTANAVKFTARGVVQLCAETEHVAGGCAVTFRVLDSGPGIPEADLPRMFEPFVQLDGSRTRRADGVGLGLAICRRLADAMGARLELHNRPEGGLSATFRVALPFASASSVARASPAAPAERLTARVLLVEDHPVSRAVVTQMLEELGARVVAVDRGALAIEKAATVPFDVALVDLHMPDMDGLTTVRALRATASPPNIVVFTADERPGAHEACREAGASALLLKPATLEELGRTVRRVAASAGSRREVEAASPRQRLVTLFARTYPAEIEQLRRAIAEGDEGACDEVLHGMQGASSLLGFAEVARLCRDTRAHVTPEAVVRIEAACALATTLK